MTVNELETQCADFMVVQLHDICGNDDGNAFFGSIFVSNGRERTSRFKLMDGSYFFRYLFIGSHYGTDLGHLCR